MSRAAFSILYGNVVVPLTNPLFTCSLRSAVEVQVCRTRSTSRRSTDLNMNAGHTGGVLGPVFRCASSVAGVIRLLFGVNALVQLEVALLNEAPPTL